MFDSGNNLPYHFTNHDEVNKIHKPKRSRKGL